MRTKKKPFEGGIERRITWVLLFFLILFSLLFGRLFALQIVDHKKYESMAARQHNVSEEILPERGSIFMQDKYGTLIPVALNKIQKNLIAMPSRVQDKESAAQMLSEEFGIKKDILLPKLSKENDFYEIIAKKIDLEKAEELIQKLPDGFTFEEEERRVYPHGELASSIIGFVSMEEDREIGRYGVERERERDLSGSKGFLEGAKDASGFLVALGRRILNPPTDGSEIILTLDFNIQKKAEEVLEDVVKKWKPISGMALVMDPKTGKILAEAVRPGFNPNEFSKEKDFSVFLNPLAESTYELGSVLKPLTMAGAIEERVVGPKSTYEDLGFAKIGGYTIRNFDNKAHGVQTMTQVIEDSLNTGMVYVSKLLGQEKHLNYLKKFGLGEKTDIDLPGEVSGNISNLEFGREIDFATASFGQGIALTPMQTARAIGALANGGVLMRPFVVEKIRDDSGGETVTETGTQGQVVSKETAEEMTKMLVSTVRLGFENKARIKGYFVAGKTGTAQVPRKDGKGYSDKVIHTFVGYAPAFNPRFLVMLQMNEPQGNRFAANTLTPAFHDLAEYILNYYEIPPDEVMNPESGVGN